jgi:hypothetical protein
VTGEEKGMTPDAWALAHALTRCEGAAPLTVRAAWASFLRRAEPCPSDLRRAALNAHERGHMRAGMLTPDGVRAALEALGAHAVPPCSIERPRSGGQVVKHEP